MMLHSNSGTQLECKQCILTSADYPGLQLDNHGICNICQINTDLLENNVFSGHLGQEKIDQMVKLIKESRTKSGFNCLVGLSGGADSSYLALKVKEWGLKPLFLHVDGGWNSESAVFNIERLVRGLHLDYSTVVLNWPQMKDLQMSFIKADVLDIDLPFDNAFMAVLYHTAAQHGIKYIISGHNTKTEGYLPPNFTHDKLDKINIKAIHSKYGKENINKFPLIGRMDAYYYTKIKNVQFFNCLDWMDYNVEQAKLDLSRQVGWKDYGLKHAENIFTRFYQNYILPKKFGIDKRKSHFSMRILSGLLTREQALLELKKPPYNSNSLFRKDLDFFIKKLEMSELELQNYIERPAIDHTAYFSEQNIINPLLKVYQPFKKIFKTLKLKKSANSLRPLFSLFLKKNLHHS